MENLNEVIRMLKLMVELGESEDNMDAYIKYHAICQELSHLESQSTITKAQYNTLCDQVIMIYHFE